MSFGMDDDRALFERSRNCLFAARWELRPLESRTVGLLSRFSVTRHTENEEYRNLDGNSPLSTRMGVPLPSPSDAARMPQRRMDSSLSSSVRTP
jgi:hypothetical protein